LGTCGLIEVAVTGEGLSGVVRVDLDGDVVVNVHVA
jgi:hypothetical protein